MTNEFDDLEPVGWEAIDRGLERCAGLLPPRRSGSSDRRSPERAATSRLRDRRLRSRPGGSGARVRRS
ncbi:MAG: hypothetical protein IT372_02705 [Polyangiaceae bacterium]|nr:hypothetical protein [Polyangiaceae bacterium]